LSMPTRTITHAPFQPSTPQPPNPRSPTTCGSRSRAVIAMRGFESQSGANMKGSIAWGEFAAMSDLAGAQHHRWLIGGTRITLPSMPSMGRRWCRDEDRDEAYGRQHQPFAGGRFIQTARTRSPGVNSGHGGVGLIVNADPHSYACPFPALDTATDQAAVTDHLRESQPSRNRNARLRVAIRCKYEGFYRLGRSCGDERSCRRATP
jgi:hypothetical protein